jgi:predicted GIY-YIG superfamily endonuclease
MSRRAPKGPPAAEVGDAYVLHLVPRYKHAGHYSGFSKDLLARLAAHAGGRGARLMEVHAQAGGTFLIGRVEHGVTRDRETVFKESSAAKVCRICKGGPEVEVPGWNAPGPPAARAAAELTPAGLGLTADPAARWVATAPDLQAPLPQAPPPEPDAAADAPQLPESFWEAEPEAGQ